MTAMLASVNSLAEAEIAFRAGVDILDLKDPGRGVLGAVPPDVAGAAARRYGGCCLVSATIGDVPPEPEPVACGIRAMAATGVDIVKVGIFGPDASPALLAALAAGPAMRIVAVLFAEFGMHPALLAALGRCGIRGVMLDTAEKGTGGLRRKLTESELREFVRRARAQRLQVGLAGSLSIGDIPALLALKPDYLGFRGALCRAGLRTATIDPLKVRRIRSMIRTKQRRAAAG
jgi:uncharacterized protein (UPF0264 family)